MVVLRVDDLKFISLKRQKQRIFTSQSVDPKNMRRNTVDVAKGENNELRFAYVLLLLYSPHHEEKEEKLTFVRHFPIKLLAELGEVFSCTCLRWHCEMIHTIQYPSRSRQ